MPIYKRGRIARVQEEAKHMIEEGKEDGFAMMMHNLERTLDEMVDKAKVEGKLEMIRELLDLGI